MKPYMSKSSFLSLVVASSICVAMPAAQADRYDRPGRGWADARKRPDRSECPFNRRQLARAIDAAEAAGDKTGGYGLNMWLVLVDPSGTVCDVQNSSGVNGEDTGNAQWLGSRVIAAQKAFTANAFSLDSYAISTANLFTATQPGNSLFELPESNPVNAEVAYAGPARLWGRRRDPLVGERMGGINVFGGGLALYNEDNEKIGAIGVSGDTSCRDHAYAWRIRAALDAEPKGTGITTSNLEVDGTLATPLAGAEVGDEIVLDLDGTAVDGYWNNWEHAACPNTAVGAANGVVEN